MRYESRVAHNKARFIESVTSGEIDLMTGKSTKSEVLSQLKALHFDSKADLNAMLRRVQADDDKEDETTFDFEGEELTVDEKAFDYLLSTSLSSLTAERIQDLMKEKCKTESDLEVLLSTQPEDMWLNDLEAVEQVLPPM